MFSIFTPPTPTRNHSHHSYLFKLFALFALLTISLSATADGYKLVKNASELSAGDIILITSGKSGSVKALGPQATNNRTGASVTISDETISSLGEAVEITLENVNENGYFSLKTGENKYLYAASSSKNYLKEQANINYWSISVNTSTYAATITDETTSYTRNILRYNSQSIIFSCYGSGQQNVYIFKKQTTPTYALTIDKPVGGTIAVTNNGSAVTSGKKFAADTELDVEATPATGYSFLAWTGTTAAFASTTTTPTTFTMPAEDAEIGATFTPNNYILTIATDNGGKMSVQVGDGEAAEKNNGETVSVPYNAMVSVTPEAAENYAFSAWSADGLTIDNTAANRLEFNMPAGDVKLTAAFISANIEYNINLTPTTCGTIAADKTKAKAGETVTLTATPTQTNEAYYVFTSWTVLDGDANEITVTDNQFTMPASAVEIKATFTQQYKVTINTPENGTLAIKNGEAAVTSGDHLPAGTVLTITATPDARYKDPVWQYKKTGDEAFTNGNGTSFTMNAKDVTFQASFTAREYHNVTFSVNGQASEPTEVEVGESITFPANPADIYGKKFVGWYGETYSDASIEPEYVNTATAVMGDADVTYYAVFANIEETEASCTETDISDFSASDVMIIVGKSGANYYALYNDNGTSGAPDAVRVTVENGKITSTVSDNIKWNGSTNGSSYQFKKTGTSNYLYCTATNNGVRVGTNTNNTFRIDHDYLQNIATSRYLGIYNQQDWRCYTSNTGNIAGQTFSFYKYIAASRTISDITTKVEKPATLESIAVTTAPTKTHYFVGETFEPAGMVVTATYDDESNKPITEYSYSPTGALTIDDDEITISYTEFGTTKTTTQAITVVTPQEAGIAFAESAVSTPLNSGYTGQALTNPHSLTVTYTSSDTNVATVDGSTGEVTLKATGTTTITASFTRNDTYQSAEVSYELTVTPAVHTVTFMVNGTQRSTDIVAEEADIDFPEVDDIAGKALAGWRTSALENVTDTEPDDMVTSATMPAADVTYHAVFAKATTTEGASNYTLDYNDNEETISELTLGYGSAVEYTAKDGGQWVIKSYKSNGMQINTERNASIKVPNCSGNITSIAITANSTNNKAVGFSSSDYTGSETLTYLAEGTNGTSQTLDLSSANVKTGYIVPNGGNCQITKIVVNYIGTVNTYSGYCTTVTGETSIGSGNEDPVSKKYYATYSSTQKFMVPEDVTVAQVIEKNGLIYLERYAAGDVVAANTGVMLESTETIDNIAFVLTAADATDLGVKNVLKASGAGITADEMGAADNPANNYFYRLTTGTLNGETVFGFYWKKTDGSAFDLGANKAYMVLPKSNAQAAPRYVWLGGQTTAIDGLNADTEATVGSDERIYSLDGRRVEGQLKRGIYVKNGKKFIVR